jgi:predicted MFS family arabinose efflux permease
VAAGAAVAGALIITLPLTPIFAIPALATLAGLTITMASHTARRRDRAQTANQPAEQR